MSENKDIQGKSTSLGGLKKSIHKSMLKDGEYHHLKNGITSSFEGDMPFVQNAPSNLECLQLPSGYVLIGNRFIKEHNFHIIFIVNPTTGSSEIGYFDGNNCSYTSKINDACLAFSVDYPIKATYQYLGCELNIYFQDGFNRDRHINLDNIPYKREVVNGCLQNIVPLALDCSRVNIQNDLTPPVVKPVSVIESGALFTGAYQFAIAYANSNGDEQSSYYSKTNPLPIYQDRFGSYNNVEGSAQNLLTDKAIVLSFSNLDIRYDYINLAVIKTVQGTPTYELVATLNVTTKEYIYTGREVTKLLSIDKLLGLYPDYYNSKTTTTANNYLLRANLSTQDEANYQPFANLIELEWVAISRKADEFDTSYKNPLLSVESKGYQRGEVYAFGIQFMLSNGRKTSVFHIPGRSSTPSDLELITKANLPASQLSNFYEFSDDQNSCIDDSLDQIERWKVYDTSTIINTPANELTGKCFDGIIAYGDFAYWESTDNYPCNSIVWGDLSGTPIRHHKFPTNNKINHHNAPYPSTTAAKGSYLNTGSYIYPIGVRLKDSLQNYINLAVSLNIFTPEEAALITGYEIVRGDRTGNKSIIGKGLMYNMKVYSETNPSTNQPQQIVFPNYPYNDLTANDPYIDSNSVLLPINTYIEQPPSGVTYTVPYIIPATLPNTAPASPYFNPFNTIFTASDPSEAIGPTENFYIQYNEYRQQDGSFRHEACFNFYPDASGNTREPFILEDAPAQDPISGDLNPDLKFFTFHSPDTSFRKPFLGTELNVHTIEYGGEFGRFDKVEGHPLLKPAIRTDSANYAVAFKSIGNYNNYVTINETNSNFRRRITNSGYIAANNTSRLSEATQIINNKFRESSVGLILDTQLDDTAATDINVKDVSRYTVGSDGKCGCKIVVEDRRRDFLNAFEVDSQCTENYKRISSYYASLKTKIPNQYGLVNTIKYVLTGKYHDVLTEATAVNNGGKPEITFGGDTFITRFSLKRKHSFYVVNFIGQSPVGMTYGKSEYSNIPNPIYHADNAKGGMLGEYTIDYSTSKLECTIDGGGILKSKRNRNGFFYLYSTGIVNFFVESDINTELRYSGANIWETWYPKLKNVTSVWDWMEEIKCSINFDNIYNYNFDYSKQNTEESLFPQAEDFNPNSQCKNTHPGRIIYSKQTSPDASTDFWLINPANNYYDADTALGAITDIQALDTFRVLVRYENGSQVFNAYDTLQLTNTSVSVGTGGMFAQRPQSFGETETGYAGSQSKFAIDTSQFGTFFIDRKRGKVFHLTSGLEEISNYGMFDWFAENSEFKIISLLPNINLDNPFGGIGYCSVFDNRFNLWFLTKKDYVLINPQDSSYINYIEETNEYTYKKLPINFEDSTVWKNVGWTISYSPIFKAWQSYHSFIPNYYISDISNFFSGLKGSSIYKHWDKFTFQNYYGIQYPFEIQITTAKEELVSILQSIEYDLKVQKYLNNNYQDLYENHNVNFNKVIVSTDNQSSGYLNLIKKDNANPYQSLQYPIVNPNSLDVLYSKVEGHKYRINQFSDLVLDKNNNIPIFLHSLNGVDFTPNNIDYAKVNTLNTQPFRNEFFDVTLINDEYKDYKFILKTFINKTLKSLR